MSSRKEYCYPCFPLIFFFLLCCLINFSYELPSAALGLSVYQTDRLSIEGKPVEHWRHNEGDFAVLKCVSGYRNFPMFFWTKDGTSLPGYANRTDLGNGSSFVAIPNINLNSEGNYTCLVSNEFGAARKDFRICVIKPGEKDDCPAWWYDWNKDRKQTI